jgi:hypothetical protein
VKQFDDIRLAYPHMERSRTDSRIGPSDPLSPRKSSHKLTIEIR